MEVTEATLIARLAKRDETAFEQVFKAHFKNLHAYAFSILRDEVAAEEAVQNVFCKIWERAGNLSINGPLAAYLYRAVNNESLNYLKHQKVKAAHALHVAYVGEAHRETPARLLQGKELEGRLRRAMNELPEQCRTIFQLSRFEELRYREIADRMGLSVKTVENQMGKALKLLREKLSDLLPFVIWLLLGMLVAGCQCAPTGSTFTGNGKSGSRAATAITVPAATTIVTEPSGTSNLQNPHH